MQWNLKNKGRKKTGARYNRRGKKERSERGRDFLPTLIGSDKRAKQRSLGGNTKVLALRASTANVIVNGKVQKAKIMQVKDNRADPQFIRRNVITKGALIETELGIAKVTSRPGQTGSVDAVLVEGKKS